MNVKLRREPKGTRQGRRLIAPLIQALEGRTMWSTVSLLQALPSATNTAAVQTLNLRDFFKTDSSNGTTVEMTIKYGTNVQTAVVDIGLFDGATPKSAANFLDYVDSGKYNGTFFHRAIAGFVLQGGGYTYDGTNAPTEFTPNGPLMNEFPTSPRDANGKVNTRGTLAFAKLGADSPGGGPDSATNEFFFNVADNSSNLDAQNGGFTTFGKVLGNGMTDIDKIMALDVINAGSPFDTLPVADSGTGTLTPSNLVTIANAKVTVAGITFTVQSSDPAVVTAAVNGDILTLTQAGKLGTANITVVATDRDGAALQQTFTYTAGVESGRILDSALQSNGTTNLVGLVGTGKLALSRLTATGALDTKFAPGGFKTVALATGFTATSAAFEPNGSIMVTGTVAGAPALMRLTAAGVADKKFGPGGVLTVKPTKAPSTVQSPIDSATTILAAQTLAGNKGIIVVGRLVTGGDRLFVARLKTDGSFDPTFASNGLFTVPATGQDILSEVTVAANGDILAGGSSGGKAIVIRLASTGAVAANTPTGGTVVVSVPGSAYASVDKILIDPRNRVVLSTTTSTDVASAAAGIFGASLIRLSPALVADAKFTDTSNQAGTVVVATNAATGSAIATSFLNLSRSSTLVTRPKAGGLNVLVPTSLTDISVNGLAAHTTLQKEDTGDLVAQSVAATTSTVKRGASISALSNVLVDGSLLGNGKFTIKLILTTDGTLAGQVATLSTTGVSLKNVQPGSAKAVKVSGKIGKTLAAGSYKLLVQLVSTGKGAVVDEVTTNDVVAATDSITVTT